MKPGARGVASLGTASAIALGIAVWLAAPRAALAAGLTLDLGSDPQSQTGSAIKVIVLLTVLSVAPAILLASTCFLRISIVLSFLRTALGVQGTPPTQVLMGLALFMTVAIMTPVGREVYTRGIEPYMSGRLPAREAYERGVVPMRGFMLKQTRESDLALFYEINAAAPPATPDDIGMHLLVPAFITSELRTSFEMGFLLYLPFLLIDLVVGSVLMALGMMMLPPAMVSLPLKLLLFVAADGWHLIVASLARSFT
jgi:flagellar biosynthetic protein FliP